MPLDESDAHWRAIRRFYGDQRAERSQLPLINHIREGLAILDELGAPKAALQAFCLHPIVQADADLARAFVPDEGALVDPELAAGIDKYALTLALEYRRCANGHLSRHEPWTLDTVSLAPFPEISLMLIADKVQNRRDFERFHLATHERAPELADYFRRWLARLGVDEERYRKLAAVAARASA